MTSALLVLALALALAACTDDGVAAPPDAVQVTPEESAATLRWALSDDPTSLDPARIVRASEEVVIDALFDSLTRLSADGRAEPALATWEVDETGTRYVFTIVSDARWHDGTPVVAADVERGWERITDGTVARPSLHAPLLRDVDGYASAQAGGGLRGVRALDERTVEVVLRRPSPQLPVLLAHPALAPVPPLAVEDQAGFALDPIGNGPFELEGDWVRNQFLRLVPAASHASDPSISELVFRVYGDDADGAIRWADLSAGQVQVADVPANHRDELGTGAEIVGASDLTTVVLASTEHPLLADDRFRRALSMLIDREGIAARTNGARVAADGLVPSGLLGAQTRACGWCSHQPLLAASLIETVVDELTESGVSIPPIRMLTSDDGVSRAVATELRTSFFGLPDRLPVVLSIESVSPVALPAEVATEGYDLVAVAWSPVAPTAESFIVSLLAPGSLGASVTGWWPPAAADLMDAIQASSGVGQRLARVQELERLVLDESVAIPIHEAAPTLAVTSDVRGLRVAPDGSVDLTAVSVGEAPA